MINKDKIMRTFWTILALTFICFIINFPKEMPISFHFGRVNFEHTFYRPDFKFKIGEKEYGKDLDLKFGLDLAGGASLLFNIDTSTVKEEDISSALESLKSNIERRINLFGVSETNVQIVKQENEYRLKIELPGVENVSSAIKLIGTTAQLKFKGEIEIPPEATATATFNDVFAKDTGINGSNLNRASVQLNPNTSEPEVLLEFDDQGAKLFATATEELLNKRIAILLDDEPITYPPTVNSVITDGKAVISGSFDNKTARELAVQLNAGALPLQINLIQQSQIGATLGKDSIDKGIFAGIVGLILVSIFMIGNYGKLGLIADIGLIIYGLITLALYRLIPVTLTFPGIVGFILSIGMAVDSNILIFERMREETRKGKNWNNAMELGFGRAWDSIKDANACTIITGLILLNPFNWPFLNTSGMVRGFAITLILGIIIGIFTGVFVTRNLLRVLAKEKIQK
ncbi:MAG: protein translocase subunit SecD [Candidatus Shapirobacteria bacterium]|nr:protein translocase subunit SecD [Candidatus Shapirobacteria bacterium]MDD3002997.1 protein translocase subunit SecD [Candidatus Shapirobacteria bacterium]MDD4383135.1 protein translocase subunit SecD [Candidatus Shapirobacteria bacterium]